jgi:hypothetical protein
MVSAEVAVGLTLGVVGEQGDVSRVFLSYRREDSIGIAGRLRDRLAGHFGADNVFFDVDTIPLGVDFRHHIDRMVAECDVVLVVIGRHWVDALDDHGQRRLDQAGDFVRLEVETALHRDIPVIPLLVDGANIPQPSQLPASLADLAYRNGTPVRHDPDFHPDVDRLLRRLVPAPSSPARSQPSGTAKPKAAPATAASSRPTIPLPALPVLASNGSVTACAMASSRPRSIASVRSGQPRRVRG